MQTFDIMRALCKLCNHLSNLQRGHRTDNKSLYRIQFAKKDNVDKQHSIEFTKEFVFWLNLLSINFQTCFLVFIRPFPSPKREVEGREGEGDDLENFFILCNLFLRNQKLLQVL